jgi:hypothetical protein
MALNLSPIILRLMKMIFGTAQVLGFRVVPSPQAPVHLIHGDHWVVADEDMTISNA